MFPLLRVSLYVTSTIAAKENAVKAGMKPGSSSLTDMTHTRFGLATKMMSKGVI
jgi:hypothetical protein